MHPWTADSCMCAPGHACNRQDKAQQAEVAQQLEAQCDWLEAQADSAGPFFMGANFSLVDCALVPWFVRSYVLQHFRGLQLPPERCTKARPQKRVPAPDPAPTCQPLLCKLCAAQAGMCIRVSAYDVS